MKRLLPLLLLIGTVLLSGCIGQPTTPPLGTNGIIISSFSPDITPITAGDVIELILEVENVGGATAEKVKTNLSGVTFGEGDLDWSCEEDTSDVSFGDLMPPENGIPGEEHTEAWTCTSPSGIKSDTVYTFDVRVNYDYSTDVTGTLTFVTGDYWRSLTQDEKEKLSEKGGISQLSQTAGPLSIKLYAGRRTRPFIIYDPEDKTYTLRVVINNVGSGKPTDNKVKIIQQKSSTGLKINCFEAGEEEREITLSRGKTASISCDLTLEGNVINRQDFTVALGFEYNWNVDSSTDVTVEKPLT